MAKRRSHLISIRLKIVALTSLTSIIMATVLSFSTGLISTHELTKQLKYELHLKAKMGAALLSQYGENIRSKGQLWASNPILLSLFKHRSLASLLLGQVEEIVDDIKEKDTNIANIMLTHDSSIIYDHNQEYSLEIGEFNGVNLLEISYYSFFYLRLSEESSDSQLVTRVPVFDPEVDDDNTNMSMLIFIDLKQLHKNFLKSIQIGKDGFSLLRATNLDYISSQLDELKLFLRDHRDVDNQEDDFLNRYLYLVGFSQETFYETATQMEIFPLSVYSVAPISEISASAQALRSIILLFGVLVTLSSVIISIIFGRRMTAPLLKLTDTILQVEKGQLNLKSNIKTNDEIGQLSKEFDRMTNKLLQNQKRLNLQIKDMEFLQTFSQTLIEIDTEEKLKKYCNTALKNYLGERLSHEFRISTQPLSENETTPMKDPSKALVFEYYFKRQGHLGNYGYLRIFASNLSDAESVSKKLTAFDIFAISCNQALETIVNTAEKLEKAALQSELRTATALQEHFFSSQNFIHSDVDIAHSLVTASKLGGDWFRIFENPHTTGIRIYLGDATGHGAGSALMTAAAISLVDHCENLSIVEKKYVCPKEIFNHINRTIRGLAGGRIMMTLTMCEINPSTGVVKVFNAGHPGPVWFQKAKISTKQRPYKTIMGISSRLGDVECPRISSKTFSMAPGDRLLIYSDGLTEAMNSSDEEYSLKRNCDVIIKSYHQKVDKIAEEVLRQLKSYTNRNSFEDDVTFVIVDRVVKGQAARLQA